MPPENHVPPVKETAVIRRLHWSATWTSRDWQHRVQSQALAKMGDDLENTRLGRIADEKRAIDKASIAQNVFAA